MKLSDGEKLILLMLADMYKAMKLKGDYDPDFISKTIYDDRLWGFNWQFSGIPFQREDDPKAVKETCDVLDMWGMIEQAYAKLSPTDKQTLEKDADPFGKYVEFNGFDANNESHYGIALYLIEDLKRFAHFKDRNMNSHSRSVDGYLRMHEVFEPLRAGLHSRQLNLVELTQILKARIHPEQP